MFYRNVLYSLVYSQPLAWGLVQSWDSMKYILVWFISCTFQTLQLRVMSCLLQISYLAHRPRLPPHTLSMGVSFWKLRKDCSKCLCRVLLLVFRVHCSAYVGYAPTSIPSEAKDFGSILSSSPHGCDPISFPRSCCLQVECGESNVNVCACVYVYVCVYVFICRFSFQLLGKLGIKR